MKRILLITFCFILLQSCFVNNAFVPTGYEPSMLKEKKDNRLNISITPLNLIKINYTRALTNKIGMNISSANFDGVNSIDLGAFHYFNTEKFNIDLGGGFQYLRNRAAIYRVIDNVSSILGGYYYTQKFNISFYSPFIAGSLIYKTQRKIALGLSLKASYNFIDDFNYYQRIDTYQGKSNPTPLDEETLNLRPDPFFSLEPACNFYLNKERTSIRVQVGYNFRYATLEHKYSFMQSYNYVNPLVNATKDHPAINPITFNICLVIYFRKKDSKKN